MRWLFGFSWIWMVRVTFSTRRPPIQGASLPPACQLACLPTRQPRSRARVTRQPRSRARVTRRPHFRPVKPCMPDTGGLCWSVSKALESNALVNKEDCAGQLSHARVVKVCIARAALSANPTKSCSFTTHGADTQARFTQHVLEAGGPVPRCASRRRSRWVCSPPMRLRRVSVSLVSVCTGSFRRAPRRAARLRRGRGRGGRGVFHSQGYARGCRAPAHLATA